MTINSTPNRDLRLAFISFVLGSVVASSLLFVFGALRVLVQSFLANRPLEPANLARAGPVSRECCFDF